MTEWNISMDGTLPMVILQSDRFTTDRMPTVEEDENADDCGRIIFQHGPVKEFGNNGTTIEIVIAALIARLQGFQAGPFANAYNAKAIVHLADAIEALESRTRDRQERGVEGTNVL